MSKRVLVVEDQEDNMQIMNDMLASAGYEVLKAVTGHKGVVMATLVLSLSACAKHFYFGLS